ncbi:MAG: DMT family transporter [Albidovulum sp.]
MERFVQVVALIVIGALWALTFPLTKIAVSAEYRAFGLIFWSSLIALIALAPVLVVRGRGLPMSAAGLWRYAFLGLCGTVFPSAASYTAAQHLPSGVLALCMALVPIFALPLALMLGTDRVTPGRMLGLGLGLVGVLLILLPDAALPEMAAVLFIPLALLAAFFYAAEGAVLGRIGGAGLDPFQLFFGASVVSVVLALPIAWITGTLVIPTRPYGGADLAVLVSGFANVICYVGYVWLIARAGSVFSAQVAYVVTGFGLLWSMLLLGETYSVWVWAAFALIFGGVLLVQPRPRSDESELPLAAPVGGPTLTP